MRPATTFFNLLLDALYGITTLVTIVVIFDLPKLKSSHLVNWAITLAVIYAALFMAIWLLKKTIPESSQPWWDFPRDRITEDTKGPWWRSLLSFIGGLTNFFYYFGLIILGMFIAMTEGDNSPIVIAFAALFGIHLVANAILHIARRRCRMCGFPMSVERAKRLLEGEWNWYVCFPCEIRAVAPDSEISIDGGDGGDGGDGD